MAAASGTDKTPGEKAGTFWSWLSRVLQNVAGALIIASIIGTGTLGVRTWLFGINLRHDVDSLVEWKNKGGRFTEDMGVDHKQRMDRIEAISTETLRRMHKHEVVAESHIGTIIRNEERSKKNETRLDDLTKRVYLHRPNL